MGSLLRGTLQRSSKLGGWGWLVLVCALIANLLRHGPIHPTSSSCGNYRELKEERDMENQQGRARVHHLLRVRCQCCRVDDSHSPVQRYCSSEDLYFLARFSLNRKFHKLNFLWL